jgi:hypothetical protein
MEDERSEPDLGSQRINGTLVSFSLSWRARKLHLRPEPLAASKGQRLRFWLRAELRMPLWDLWSCETLLSCDEPGALRQVGRLRTRALNRRPGPALRPRPVLALEVS